MDPLPILRDLVAANSVNPSLVPGAPGEVAAAEVAADAMRRAGLDVTRQQAAPGRPNVIGVLEGRTRGAAVMFCGHLDTVGVEGMEAPFTPREEGGRLFGRGAQDMKGGVAAMIAAGGLLARDWPIGRLIVAAVVDEEYESLGAEALVRDWRADAAIVTEPTDLMVAIGHRGFAWLEVVTHGRAAHGSRPREGRDAIARMGRVLAALERRDRELQSRPPAGVQGTASLHASLISGGRELSSYPDRCTLQFERRTVAGETTEIISDEIATILADLRAVDPEFEATSRLLTSRPSHAISADHPLATTLQAALAGCGQPAHAAVGMSFWTDAAILAGAGIPSVLFGPGGAGLHSTVEYVNVDDVHVCRDALARAARAIAAGALNAGRSPAGGAPRTGVT